jgi:hypothetical protein
MVGLLLKRAISFGERVAAHDIDLGLWSFREVEKLAECEIEAGRVSVLKDEVSLLSSFSYPGLVGQSGSPVLLWGLE